MQRGKGWSFFETKIKAINPFVTRMIPETFVNSQTICQFEDSAFGLFWRKPVDMARGRGNHPDRSKTNRSQSATRLQIKLSPAEIQKRLEDRGIQIIPESYQGLNILAEFTQEGFPGSFWSKPSSLLYSETAGHPDGWPDKFSKRVKGKTRILHSYDGRNLSMNDLKTETQLSESCIRTRLHAGLPLEKHLTNIELIFQQMNLGIRYDKYIGRQRPDFQLSEQIFVNVDGLYWHSVAAKEENRNRHFAAREQLEERGLRLLQFREDELMDKPRIVASMCNNLLKKNKQTYARKCHIRMVCQSEATTFLNEHHLMGSFNAHHVGLFSESELIMLLSYKKKDGVGDISRLCTKIDTYVVGGFSKLFKFVKHLYPKWTFWTDLRYGTGTFLTELGWKCEKTVPSWKWTDFRFTYNRLRCRANMNERKLTEKQQAEELGWYKIYDAGQRLYSIVIT